MAEDTKRILELLASGKVTVEEAGRLLQAIENGKAASGAEAAAPAEKPPARYLRIQVNRGENGFVPGSQVNMRVPISAVKGGMRLGAMIPGYGDAIAEQLQRQGFDLDVAKASAANLESALRSLGELGEFAIDVGKKRSKVRISCE